MLNEELENNQEEATGSGVEAMFIELYDKFREKMPQGPHGVAGHEAQCMALAFCEIHQMHVDETSKMQKEILSLQKEVRSLRDELGQ